jgi:hypothetical protein
MKRAFKPLMPLLAAAALCGTIANVPSASAVTIDINTCWSSCENVGNPGSPITVATLDITQNGANVDFTLTDLTGNLGAFQNAATIISNLNFTYTGGSLVVGDFSAVAGGTGGVGTFSVGPFVDAGLNFNVNLDLPPPPGAGANLLTNGESVSWTVSNDLVANFSTATNSTMVHIQRLENGGSVKFVNGPGTTVPEPASVILLGSGLAGIGLWGMKRRKNG